MAIAWFICPYKRRAGSKPIRYCAMDDFSQSIAADAGIWHECEILGDRAIVKVRASATTLSNIAATPTFRRIPLQLLNDSLSTLTAGQRNAIKNELLDAGYTLSELTAAFPDLSLVSLRDVLMFLASRRKQPRYDTVSDTIILDGPVQSCRPIDEIDEGVS